MELLGRRKTGKTTEDVVKEKMQTVGVTKEGSKKFQECKCGVSELGLHD